ncbi:hypothetical protein AJ79_09293 [Helicocarpus griseus UAMH5409]|uniref:tyrosinase n=1 Tax=Helicocarpus griseus UAMH5409 TaxID=1447875 RepID=A0A2B7WKZ8_9EURO|nr:hypothetical protein AJ79_09293 [Helicocarpus griseus UAMH5409]
MAYSYYPIVGISAGKDPNGQVPLRQDIDNWSMDRENRTQIVLFLKALKQLHDIPPGERDSFFQIAGLKIFPSFASVLEYMVCLTNRGTNPAPRKPKWEKRGIAPMPIICFLHGTGHIYYSSRHQRLYEIMINDIIPQYPEKDQSTLRYAADTWRLPYWDWAANPKIPWLATEPQLQVSLLEELETIPNPLYQFRMPNGKNMASEGVGDVKLQGEEAILSYGNCIATSRCPLDGQTEADSKHWIEGVVNPGESDRYMVEHISVDDTDYGTTAEMVYRLLTYPLEYAQFSTMAIDEQDIRVATDVNIEFIHNNIHWWVGGEGGHMSQIPVATFDPIFWLHHCNIDRIWAIWQELNPDKWFEKGGQGEFDQKVIGLGNVITNTTPLRPFHKTPEGAVWLPEDTLDFRKLGYTYPELQPWLSENETGNALDQAAYKTKLFESITRKYGICRLEALSTLERVKNGTGTPLPEGMREIDGGIAGNDFAISIRYSKFAFGGHPFNLNIFLEPENGSGRHFTPEEYVTNVYNFSNPAVVNGEEVCTNCAILEEQDVTLSAYVPITSILNRLIQEKRLRSLEKDDVEDVLKRLYWQVTMGGQSIPEEQWGRLNLQILVSMSEISHSLDPQIPSKLEREPEVFPSLGVGVMSETGNATGFDLSVDQTMKLTSEISPGGFVMVESSSLDLARPPSRDFNEISFVYVDESTEELRESSFEALISVNINRRHRKIQIRNKPAGQGWNQTMIDFPDWFQEMSTLQVRVDVQDSTYELFLNDHHVRTGQRNGNKNITHLQYEAGPEPNRIALSAELRVTTSTS